MLYKVRQYLRILNFVFNIFFFDASALIVKKNIYELFKQIYLRWYKKMQISRRLLIHEWWKIVENVFNLTAIAFPCNKIYEELVQHEMNTKWRWKIKVSIFLFFTHSILILFVWMLHSLWNLFFFKILLLFLNLFDIAILRMLISSLMKISIELFLNIDKYFN